MTMSLTGSVAKAFERYDYDFLKGKWHSPEGYIKPTQQLVTDDANPLDQKTSASYSNC